MLVNRTIEKTLQSLLTQYPILSLTGPRQAGKTTLLKKLLPNYRYVSLEDTDMRTFATEDPRDFLNTFDQFVIFDEAQRVPTLFNYLQNKVDTDQVMGQYVISGSQNFLLLESITQSLAGRVAMLQLFPFDFAELTSAQLLPNQYTSLFYTGSYPAIFNRNLSPTTYYNNYVNTYVERDVRTIINVKDLAVFRLFLKLCAGRVGQVLNLNSLATECGISSHTARAWLGILEASSIVFLMTPFFQNINKRLVKSQKLYFWDIGLLSFLLDIRDPEQLVSYYLRGNMFENMILSEIHKRNYHEQLHQNFYFYRDSNQNEIDL
ncbi:MAG: ATP-binding protein, partial [Runella slithyformis]